MSKSYEYEVDGSVIHADDDLIDGREIRTSARLVPPRAIVLIRTAGRIAQSVGLKAQAHREKSERPVFRASATMHVNTLPVDQPRWTRGAERIAEQDISANRNEATT